MSDTERASPLKTWAKTLKREIHALYLAARDPRTPWYAKAVGFIVVGYALSPIDLIPDFVPVLGYLDDLILLPLGILLFRKLVPEEVMQASRKVTADSILSSRVPNRFAAAVIVTLWTITLIACGWIAWKLWHTSR